MTINFTGLDSSSAAEEIEFRNRFTCEYQNLHTSRQTWTRVSRSSRQLTRGQWTSHQCGHQGRRWAGARFYLTAKKKKKLTGHQPFASWNFKYFVWIVLFGVWRQLHMRMDYICDYDKSGSVKWAYRNLWLVSLVAQPSGNRSHSVDLLNLHTEQVGLEGWSMSYWKLLPSYLHISTFNDFDMSPPFNPQ